MTLHMQGYELERLEAVRLERQAALDAERSTRERNKWGQFATPPALARDIVHYALSLHPRGAVRFLEPSCGTGAFYSALLRSLGSDHSLESATGMELDPRFAATARELWGKSGLSVIEGDFLDPNNRIVKPASLVVANPPYVRHHHLDSATKTRAIAMSLGLAGIKPSGLSGLYIYFMLLSHGMLDAGAVSAWLIPAEFMDVNYGSALKEYLTKRVTLRRIHRFDPADVQFNDALVTSAVVVFENLPPTDTSVTEFTYGGSISAPRDRHQIPTSQLKPTAKWSAIFRMDDRAESGVVLSDYFKIRRGIATGSNKYFVMTVNEAQARGFKAKNLTPLVPSPRYISGDTIETAPNGYPNTTPQLVVINTTSRLIELRKNDPALAEYLAHPPSEVLSSFLVRQRDPWYKQEQREPAPFLLTYMGRGVGLERPLKFILNRSEAIATNMYLMLYPTPLLQGYLDVEPEGFKKIHAALLSLTGEELRNGGRVYGGGLHKMEPKELGALRATAIMEICPERLSLELEAQLSFDI